VIDTVALQIKIGRRAFAFFPLSYFKIMTRLFAGTPFDIPPRCDRCGELEEVCKCEPLGPDRLPAEKQTAKVRADRRKHKRMVTVVWGLDPVDCDLPELLSKLKAACGSGGSLQDDQIELQGDHVSRVKNQLKEIGFKLAK
jgi:translation initiation factor 1